MIKLIILDAGDVLYTVSREELDKTVRIFLSKHGIEYSSKIDEEWDKRSSLLNHGKITLKEAQEKWLEGIGLDKSLQPEWERCATEYDKRHKIKNGVKETLKKLKNKKYKLAVLSDCPHDKKTKKMILRSVGIDYFFDEIFTSYDIGFMKPEKRAYLTVLNHFNIEPEESVFVSNDPEETDGARKLGINSILFNYKRTYKADFYITRFSQILKILEGLG